MENSLGSFYKIKHIPLLTWWPSNFTPTCLLPRNENICAHIHSLFKNTPGSFLHTRLKWETPHMPIMTEWIDKLQCIQITPFGNNEERTSITTTQQPGMNVRHYAEPKKPVPETNHYLVPCMWHSGVLRNWSTPLQFRAVLASAGGELTGEKQEGIFGGDGYVCILIGIGVTY